MISLWISRLTWCLERPRLEADGVAPTSRDPGASCAAYPISRPTDQQFPADHVPIYKLSLARNPQTTAPGQFLRLEHGRRLIVIRMKPVREMVKARPFAKVAIPASDYHAALA